MIAVLRDSERGYMSFEMLEKDGGEYLLKLVMEGPLWLLQGYVAEAYPLLTIIPMEDRSVTRDWDHEARKRITDR